MQFSCLATFNFSESVWPSNLAEWWLGEGFLSAKLHDCLIMWSHEVTWAGVTYCRVISTLHLQRRHMSPIYRRMIILLRIFKKYKSKKLKNCENEIIISYFALIHLIQFFSLEKEKYSFHMGLKTRIRMFYSEYLTKTLY